MGAICSGQGLNPGQSNAREVSNLLYCLSSPCNSFIVLLFWLEEPKYLVELRGLFSSLVLRRHFCGCLQGPDVEMNMELGQQLGQLCVRQGP